MGFNRPSFGVGNDIPRSTESPIPSPVVTGNLPASIDAPVPSPVEPFQPAVKSRDGATRAEITPEMIEAWKRDFPEIHPMAWRLIEQMTATEAFQLIAGISFQHHRMEQQLAQQAQSEVDTPESLTKPEHPTPDEVIAIASHSLVIPLTEDEESGDSSGIPQDEVQTLDSLLDPRTQELLSLAEKVGMEKALKILFLEGMNVDLEDFNKEVAKKQERIARGKLENARRWFFNVEPGESEKKVAIDALFDLGVLIYSWGLDWVTGKPLLDFLKDKKALGFLGLDLDDKFTETIVKYVTDKLSDKFLISKSVDKAYALKREHEVIVALMEKGYSREDAEMFIHSDRFKTGGYSRKGASLLSGILTIFAPDGLREIISPSGLTAFSRLNERLPHGHLLKPFNEWLNRFLSSKFGFLGDMFDIGAGAVGKGIKAASTP
ncbi:MAG TPA: hypothetical protein PK957_00790 [Candidatus Dojkabacteria bacterium]|nr:hypothetical protein [Candidatus Dojkabacteria bacterium]